MESNPHPSCQGPQCENSLADQPRRSKYCSGACKTRAYEARLIGPPTICAHETCANEVPKRSGRSLYCSNQCQAAGRAAAAALRRKESRDRDRICEAAGCNVSISGTNPYRKYCSKPCKDRSARPAKSGICMSCGVSIGSRSIWCRPCSAASRSGPNSPAWKGGRYTNGEGYVYVLVENHPRASRGSRGYVLEHILVMEKHLGRYLFPGENVHHRHGVKNDNRIEHLELWVISQPSGQRPEDLVAWADEILERYAAWR